MPSSIDVGGVLHWRYDEQAVLERVTNPETGVVTLEPLDDAAFTVQNKAGEAMTPLDPETLDPLPLLVVAPSVTPPMLLPDRHRVVYVGSGLTFEMDHSDIAKDVEELETSFAGLLDRIIQLETATPDGGGGDGGGTSAGTSAGRLVVLMDYDTEAEAWPYATLAEAEAAGFNPGAHSAKLRGPIGRAVQPTPPPWWRDDIDSWERGGA